MPGKRMGKWKRPAFAKAPAWQARFAKASAWQSKVDTQELLADERRLENARGDGSDRARHARASRAKIGRLARPKVSRAMPRLSDPVSARPRPHHSFTRFSAP